MKTVKRIMCVLLTVLLLFTAASAGVSPLVARAAGSYFFYVMSGDIQAYSFGHDLSYNGNCKNAWTQQLPLKADGSRQVCLARNEAEGFQLYFTEFDNTDGETRSLRITVSPFLNSAGEELASTVYREIFMTGEEVGGCPNLAEALLPYDGEPVETTPNDNMMFYVELKSDKEQTPGDYRSVVTLYDGDTALTTRTVTATVWHFALPEAHYATNMFGLYDSISGYPITSGFLRASGVRFTEAERLRDEDIIPEDRALALEILKAWDEVLLQHGVSASEIPRFLIETDAKAAQLTMADPRRKVFCVPLLNRKAISQNAFNAATEEMILRYKELVYDNDFLKDKAFFYPEDEQNWESGTPDALFNAQYAALEAIWPGAHITVPMNSYNTGTVEARRGKTDILCMVQSLLKNYEGARTAFTDGTWTRTWRYMDHIDYGQFYLYKSKKSTIGIFRRILYWQQEVLHSDGMLNWNCAFLPVYDDGSVYNVWENNTLPPNFAPGHGNGESLLIYPGTALGLPADEPVVSLRLKQIVSGLDDYDYLQLTKEFLGENSDAYTNAINTVLPRYASSGIERIWNPETQDWDPCTCTTVNNARVALGNALDAAWLAGNADHAYGDWVVAVTPDETHNGLAIRTCADCGAEESKKIYLCDDGSHNDSIYAPIDENTHSVTCSICGRSRTEAHTPVETEGKAPTCTEDGYTAGVICEKCGAVLENTEVLHAAHTLTETPETAPGCESDGNIAYWYCTRCEKYFADEACTREITLADTVISAAHTLGEWINEIPANCMNTGVKGHFHCDICQKDFDAQMNGIADLTIQKDETNHAGEIVLTGRTAATCTRPGYTGDEVCSACGNTVRTGHTQDATGHRWDGGTITAPPTCKAEGKRVYVCLNGCGETREESIAKLTTHTWDGGAVTKAPTCTENGEKTLTCTVCGATTKEAVEKLGHTAPNGSGRCDRCGVQLVEGCKYCGQIHTGFMGKIVGFFHNIMYFFRHLFG